MTANGGEKRMQIACYIGSQTCTWFFIDYSSKKGELHPKSGRKQETNLVWQLAKKVSNTSIMVNYLWDQSVGAHKNQSLSTCVLSNKE